MAMPRSDRTLTTDRHGRSLQPGQKVRITADPVQEGEIRRVVPRYGVLTVIVPGEKAGLAERMVRAQDVEAV